MLQYVQIVQNVWVYLGVGGLLSGNRFKIIITEQQHVEVQRRVKDVFIH